MENNSIKVNGIESYAYQDATGRVAQVADLQFHGQKVVIGNTHLDQPRRAIQVGELVDYMKSNYEKSSLVVCGDFNATLGSLL